MSKGFARSGWPRGSELLLAANLVANATPHTVGDWVDIDASAAADFAGMWIRSNVSIGANGVDTSMLLDIGVGGAGTSVDNTVVASVPVGGHGIKIPFFLPVYIPAGTRVAGRIQAAVTVDVYGPEVVPVYGSRPGMWSGYTIAEPIGVNLATSGPTTGDLADNAWDEAVASTANAYRALTLHVCSVPGATSASGGSITVDAGVGAAGSEVVIGSWRTQETSNETIIDLTGPAFVERAIPAGSRLAIRKNSASDLSAALIGWR